MLTPVGVFLYCFLHASSPFGCSRSRRVPNPPQSLHRPATLFALHVFFPPMFVLRPPHPFYRFAVHSASSASFFIPGLPCPPAPHVRPQVSATSFRSIWNSTSMGPVSQSFYQPTRTDVELPLFSVAFLFSRFKLCAWPFPPQSSAPTSSVILIPTFSRQLGDTRDSRNTHLSHTPFSSKGIEPSTPHQQTHPPPRCFPPRS